MAAPQSEDANKGGKAANTACMAATAVLDLINVPLVVLGAGLKILHANPAFLRAFSTEGAGVKGRPLLALGRWHGLGMSDALERVLSEDEPLHGLDIYQVCTTAGQRLFHVSAVPLEGTRNMLVTLEDITERQNALDTFQLAAIVANSSDAILSLDLAGRVTSWNGGAERLFGWTEAEMRGHTLDRLMPPEHEGEVERLIGRVRQGEHIHFYETRRMHKDGRVLDVSLTVSPMLAANGEVVGISKIERDISAIRQTEASLKESRQRFAMLADNMDQLAWIANADSTQYWTNHRWTEFTGIPSSDLTFRRKEIHHPDHYERVSRQIAAFTAKREPWESTFPLRRHDGVYRWMLARAMPALDPDGKDFHWFGTCTDITDMMKAEEALLEADRKKDEFLATLAHELRNPMAPLRTGLDLLQTMPGDADFVHTRKVMKRQVDHLARLVEDLLELSRINTGSFKLHPVPMDPVESMHEAMETTEPLIRAKRQELVVRRSPASAFINGDPIRITQVFSNLLHNASKFTPKGGMLTTSWEVDDKWIIFNVMDNGVGIPESERQHVFDMFAQIGQEEKAKAGGGLGIGLHLVKRLVGMHGGEVAVKSGEFGVGSIFSVKLPVISAKPKPVDRTVQTGSAIKGKRILLVDDNKDSAVMLSMLLKGKGAEVEVAYSGEQGMKMGDVFRPAIVLMDIGMPGMDGYQACKAMRLTDWGANIRLVALSGWGQAGDKARSKEAGFDDHLVKPVGREVLFKTLEGS